PFFTRKRGITTSPQVVPRFRFLRWLRNQFRSGSDLILSERIEPGGSRFRPFYRGTGTSGWFRNRRGSVGDRDHPHGAHAAVLGHGPPLLAVHAWRAIGDHLPAPAAKLAAHVDDGAHVHARQGARRRAAGARVTPGRVRAHLRSFEERARAVRPGRPFD